MGGEAKKNLETAIQEQETESRQTSNILMQRGGNRCKSIEDGENVSRTTALPALGKERSRKKKMLESCGCRSAPGGNPKKRRKLEATMKQALGKEGGGGGGKRKTKR